MSRDFTLSASQRSLQLEARAFARGVLREVRPATMRLPTPEARFLATRPMQEATIASG